MVLRREGGSKDNCTFGIVDPRIGNCLENINAVDPGTGSVLPPVLLPSSVHAFVATLDLYYVRYIYMNIYIANLSSEM